MKKTVVALMLLMPLTASANHTLHFYAKFYTVFGITGAIPPGQPPCGDLDFPDDQGPECLTVSIDGAGWAWKMGITRLGIQDVLVFNQGPPTVTSQSILITAANGDMLWGSYEQLPAAADGTIAGPMKIIGGTGRFEGAYGKLKFFAKSNFANGTAVVRLRGKIRFK